MNNKRKALKKIFGCSAVASVLPIAWIKPVVNSVVLPAHANTSTPMAVMFGLEHVSSVDCFDDAQFADIVFDFYIYENNRYFQPVEAKIKDIRVGDSIVWNISVTPLTIKPEQNMYISRGFHLPASNPLDFSGSGVDIIFVDGSVLSIPAINC